MIPGGPRNARQMEQMMRRMGVSTEEIDGVEEVVIRTRTQEQVFRAPEVTVLTVRGVKTYQIVGQPELRARGAPGAPAAPRSAAAPSPPAGASEEDLALVMEQTGATRDEATEALFRANGQPAEAILALLARRGSG